MTYSALHIIGGIVLAIVIFFVIYIIIGSSNKKPSGLSWLLMAIMACIIAIFGARLFCAIDNLTNISDNNKYTSSYVDDVADFLSGGDYDDEIYELKEFAHGILGHTSKTSKQFYKNKMWYSIMFIVLSMLELGGIAVLTAETPKRRAVRPEGYSSERRYSAASGGRSGGRGSRRR